jgi:hypothetical protein
MYTFALKGTQKADIKHFRKIKKEYLSQKL